MSELGNWLKRGRDAQGMTKEALATAMEMSLEQLTGWESGGVTPEPAALERLRELLGPSSAVIDHSWLSRAIALKDQHSMRGIASELGVRVSEVAVAFRRHGITRIAIRDNGIQPAEPTAESVRGTQTEPSGQPLPVATIVATEEPASFVGQVAWRVEIRTGTGRTTGIVVGPTLVDAATQCRTLAEGHFNGTVVSMTQIAPLLD